MDPLFLQSARLERSGRRPTSALYPSAPSTHGRCIPLPRSILHKTKRGEALARLSHAMELH